MATSKTRSKRPTPTTLAEIGKTAMRRAQAEALWTALEAHDFSPSAAAEALSVPGGSANVLRLLKRLGLTAQYDRERAARGLKPGRRPA